METIRRKFHIKNLWCFEILQFSAYFTQITFSKSKQKYTTFKVAKISKNSSLSLDAYTSPLFMIRFDV